MDDLPIQITEETSFVDFARAHEVQKARRQPLKREKIAQAYDEAFELIGGVPRLAHFAHSDPKEFYKLHARLIPTEQKTQFDGKIQIVGFVRPTALDGYIEGECEELSPSTANDSER
jgi:hypothetical protein